MRGEIYAVAFTLLLGGIAFAADDAPVASAPRIAKIKVTNGPADIAKRRTLTDSRIAFQPGKRAELKIDGIQGEPKVSRVEIAVNSELADALQRHIVDVQLISHGDKKHATILAAPKLLVREGAPAHVRIGGADADSLEIEVLIEPAKAAAAP